MVKDLRNIFLYDDFNKIVSLVGILFILLFSFILYFIIPVNFYLPFMVLIAIGLFIFLKKNTVKQVLIQKPNDSGVYEFYLEYWDRKEVEKINSKHFYRSLKGFKSRYVPLLRLHENKFIFIEWENLDRSNYVAETLDSLTGAEELNTMYESAKGMTKREIINYSFYTGIIIAGALLIFVIFSEYREILYPKQLIPDNVIIEETIINE
tara:strand:+ start:165 stop:788 length:624 start_codon:yes stop_codon:yes gene_type:complete